MKLDPADEKHRTAIHEAAHTVAYYATLGTAPAITSIRPNPERGNLGHSTTEWQPFGESDAAKESYIVQCFAGFAAEGRFFPTGEANARVQCEDDDDLASVYLSQLPGKPLELESSLRARASEFVASEWSAIERVAIELLEHEILDADEAATSIEIVHGQATEAELVAYRAMKGLAEGRPA